MTSIEPTWSRAGVSLFLGDCREILPTLTGVDAVVSSPPYNTLGGRLPEKPSGMHAETRWISNTKAVGYADDMDEGEYQQWHNETFSLCASTCVDGGSVFINHKCRWRDTHLWHPVQWIAVSGARLRQEIIWMRSGSTTLNARMFAPNEERVLWFVVGNHKWVWNQEAASWLSVWRINQDNDPNGHPCPYPMELPTRCILATTHHNGIVLDPFLGSGTTGVAAVRTGRKFIGIEIDKKYFAIAVRRINEAIDQGALFAPEPPAKVDPSLFVERTSD